MPERQEDSTFDHFWVKEYNEVPIVALGSEVTTPLAPLIHQRLSCRAFAAASISLAEISTVLSQAYGYISGEHVDGIERYWRPGPSAGSCYPLELYLVANRVDGLEGGTYHYGLIDHALECLRTSPVPAEQINELFLGQRLLAKASAIIVITAVFERCMQRYGDRGYRYILIEAGHVGQNVMLSSASLAVGRFLDNPLAELFGLDTETEAPIYSIALGHQQPGTAGQRSSCRA